MTVLPASEFPETIAVIQSLGGTDIERAAALGVDSTKTIERLRKRLPSTLAPFIDSPHAVRILEAILSDVKQRQFPSLE